MFSDEDEDKPEDRRPRAQDEFADFIEQDEFSDDEIEKIRDDEEVAKPGRKAFSMAGLDVSTLDEASMEDYRAAFGTGEEYDWALAAQDDADALLQTENKEKGHHRCFRAFSARRSHAYGRGQRN